MWQDRLRDELKRQSLTLRRLSESTGGEVGIDRLKTYTRMASRIRHPHGDTLEKIAAALGVDPVWLRTGVGNRDGAPPRQPGAIDERLLAEITPSLNVRRTGAARGQSRRSTRSWWRYATA